MTVNHDVAGSSPVGGVRKIEMAFSRFDFLFSGFNRIDFTFYTSDMNFPPRRYTAMSIEKVRAYFSTLGIEERVLEFDVSGATV